MDGIALTRNIRQLIKATALTSPRFMRRKPDHKMGGRLSTAVTDTNINHLGCNIWAITAMNENEILMHVKEGMLDGISVKPLSLKQVEKIINGSGIPYTKVEI